MGGSLGKFIQDKGCCSFSNLTSQFSLEGNWYSVVLWLQAGSRPPHPHPFSKEGIWPYTSDSVVLPLTLPTPVWPVSHLLFQPRQSLYLHPPVSLPLPLGSPKTAPPSPSSHGCLGNAWHSPWQGGEQGNPPPPPVLARLGWNLIAQQVWGGRTQNPSCMGWATWPFAPGSQHGGPGRGGGARAPAGVGATFTHWLGLAKPIPPQYHCGGFFRSLWAARA